MHKILVIDDSMFNVKIVQAAMTSLGYEVVEAYNGNEGVIKAKKELPNLIFMDINMPVMDGIESMKRIKEVPALKKIPVIAYTAYAMNGDKEMLLAEGFDEYLSKPVSISGLIDTAKKLLH